MMGDALATAAIIGIGVAACLLFAVTCDADLAREVGDFVAGYLGGG